MRFSILPTAVGNITGITSAPRYKAPRPRCPAVLTVRYGTLSTNPNCKKLLIKAREVVMDLQRIIYSIPGIIIGFTIHEYCHALAAYKLGDTTVQEDGRLTLDPLKHIDPIGMLFIILAGFGWAKPVTFHPSMLKNPTRDKIIIAAAGPLSNLLLGVLFVLILKSLWLIPLNNEKIFDIIEYITDVLYYWAFTNVGLFVFNILPIPPLDGSHIFLSGLKLSTETENKIMRTGSIILFIVLMIQNRSGYDIIPIGKIINAVISLII
jgi:Zn-dependent protease